MEGMLPAQKEEVVVRYTHTIMTPRLFVTTYACQCLRQHIQRVVEGQPTLPRRTNRETRSVLITAQERQDNT